MDEFANEGCHHVWQTKFWFCEHLDELTEVSWVKPRKHYNRWLLISVNRLLEVNFLNEPKFSSLFNNSYRLRRARNCAMSG